MPKKRKKLLWNLLLAFLIFYLMIRLIYVKYYKIDFSTFHTIHFVAAATSPDKEHFVGVTVYKTDTDADVAYICARLTDLNAEHHVPDSKIIYWDKVLAAEIESFNPVSDGDGLYYSTEVDWVDTENFKIHGKIINIYKTWDYRRNFDKLR